jgi:hypothetical protein
MYAYAFALSDLINKNSTWLKATVVEGKGSGPNMRWLAAHPEAVNTTITMANQYAQIQAERGEPPWEKPYAGSRFLAVAADAITMMVTLDKNIKTWDDLAGKRVALFMKGTIVPNTAQYILDYGHGIWDKVKPQYMHWGPTADGLIDGTLDAGIMTCSVITPEGDWAPAPPLDKLMRTKPTYFVSLDKEKVAIASQKSGWPLIVTDLKPKAIGVSDAQAFNGLSTYNSYFVDVNMDDKIVNEILRIMYDNAEKFGEYDARAKRIAKTTLAAAKVDRSKFHPAAVKFYEGKGIKVGIDFFK